MWDYAFNVNISAHVLIFVHKESIWSVPSKCQNGNCLHFASALTQIPCTVELVLGIKRFFLEEHDSLENFRALVQALKERAHYEKETVWNKDSGLDSSKEDRFWSLGKSTLAVKKSEHKMTISETQFYHQIETYFILL